MQSYIIQLRLKSQITILLPILNYYYYIFERFSQHFIKYFFYRELKNLPYFETCECLPLRQE